MNTNEHLTLEHLLEVHQKLNDGRLHKNGFATVVDGILHDFKKQEKSKQTEEEFISINRYCYLAHKNADEHGWWQNPKEFGSLLDLIHSELSEALEEFRDHREPTETYYSGKVKFEDLNVHFYSNKKGEVKTTSIGQTTITARCDKPEGIPSELADVVIRVFDLCGYYGIDLESAINEKMRYNKTRPYLHGGRKL